jgi:CRISPR system Cascade subunit CasC
MHRFLQLHLLTFYPPANLNRDDTGKPKTAIVGGVPRLRVSSQALKRAFRTSDGFKKALDGHMGSRTQRLGEQLFGHLISKGSAPEAAMKIVREIIPVFGKPKADKDKNPAHIEQLAFIAPAERAAAFALADRMVAGETVKVEPDAILVRTDTAADIALFGRMLADNPDYKRDAAAQVAHSITTHKVTIEDDYYTAMDDLKMPAEGAGAGFVGEAGFGSGVFYLYACIDRALLARNLGNDAALATTALVAFTEAAATVSPRGKQNSFAAHGRAHYLLAEAGDAQPRTLAGAFAKPVTGHDLMADSVSALGAFRGQLERAYGPAASTESEMNVLAGTGSLAGVLAFIRGLEVSDA